MEKLDLRRSSCRVNVLGTIVTVCGAYIVILYKGSVIFSTSSYPHQNNSTIISQQSKWVFGGLMIAMACLMAAMWNIVQVSLVENCPSMVTIVFSYNFFMTIQCTVFSLFVERNWNTWQLRFDIKMISIVLTAIFGTVLRIGVHTWCLQQKGPIFVAMFKPLGIAIAAVMVVMFLGDSLTLAGFLYYNLYLLLYFKF